MLGKFYSGQILFWANYSISLQKSPLSNMIGLRYNNISPPVSQRIQYRITATVCRCVLRYAPSYLCNLCCPVSVLAARGVLRSAARDELLVLRIHLATVQRRAFSVVGPSAWNDLHVELRSLLMAAFPNFTSLVSPSSLAVTGLREYLSSSVLKRRYISLRMNE